MLLAKKSREADTFRPFQFIWFLTFQFNWRHLRGPLSERREKEEETEKEEGGGRDDPINSFVAYPPLK